ncbi:energy transducer TonB [Marinoscillum furvescens]|uniref:Protein TonB n=1 Tax=Marinoscillum furvescens DSM 4134 TaxID=1122208 RepID=A0A3D9KYN9_MARFU|nr:energy transducer TonB [Marinoscillum furvescens]RED93651.1 protein TonB [Marinoscillum furvescens DSM 4134]
MEPKKNPEIDLHRKRPLFFTIGLVIALLCVTVAFEWKAPYDPVDLTVTEDPFETLYVVPATVIPPPKAPEPIKKEVIKKSLAPPVFVEKPDELPIVDEPVDTEFPDEIPDFGDEPIDDPVETVFHGHELEVQPEFPGGMDAFYAYMANNIRYPSQAKNLGITGRVYVQFVIDKDGSLTEVEVIKGPGAGISEEALRVILGSPKWNPGKQRGRPVKVRMVLPITFDLK